MTQYVWEKHGISKKKLISQKIQPSPPRSLGSTRRTQQRENNNPKQQQITPTKTLPGGVWRGAVPEADVTRWPKGQATGSNSDAASLGISLKITLSPKTAQNSASESARRRPSFGMPRAVRLNAAVSAEGSWGLCSLQVKCICKSRMFERSKLQS